VIQVHQGGKVPKSMYQKAEDLKADSEGDWITASVKKGDTLRLDYEIEEIGSFLK
jgi:hypothetical protein